MFSRPSLLSAHAPTAEFGETRSLHHLQSLSRGWGCLEGTSGWNQTLCDSGSRAFYTLRGLSADRIPAISVGLSEQNWDPYLLLEHS